MRKPIIDIGRAPALVLMAQTGIVYTNQAGGIACLHPTLEGALIQPEWLYKFSQALEALSCDLGCYGQRFNTEDADKLEANWPKPLKWFNWWMRLDRDHLDQGTEAWIPVVAYCCGEPYDQENKMFLEWVDGRHGFLALENCD